MVSLVEDGALLLIIEAFEVVGLDSVRSQHRGHGSWVFSHQIVSVSILKLMSLLVQPVLSCLELQIAFLLGLTADKSKETLPR